MNTIDIIFVLMIAITIMLVVWSLVMAKFMDKTEKALKDLADNQFDAEQVMKLYSMKYAPKPKIITEQKNVIDLIAELDLPIREAENNSDRQIKDQLVRDIAEEIEPYVEVISDTDLRSMEIRYKARLQVIDK